MSRFARWTVEVTDGQVSLPLRMSFTLMYCMSASCDIWTSMDIKAVLLSVSTPPLRLSARSRQCISYTEMENVWVLLRWVSLVQVSSVAPLLHYSA